MTDHEKALAILAEMEHRAANDGPEILEALAAYAALRAVLEMHINWHDHASCVCCDPAAVGLGGWPCPTVLAITKALDGDRE